MSFTCSDSPNKRHIFIEPSIFFHTSHFICAKVGNCVIANNKLALTLNKIVQISTYTEFTKCKLRYVDSGSMWLNCVMLAQFFFHTSSMIYSLFIIYYLLIKTNSTLLSYLRIRPRAWPSNKIHFTTLLYYHTFWIVLLIL